MALPRYELLNPGDTCKEGDEWWQPDVMMWVKLGPDWIGDKVVKDGTPIRRPLTLPEAPATMEPLADTRPSPINLSPLTKLSIAVMENEIEVEVKEINFCPIIRDCDEELAITFIIHSIRKNKMKDSTNPPFEGKFDEAAISLAKAQLKQPPMMDQGACGNSSAFAAASALEMMRKGGKKKGWGTTQIMGESIPTTTGFNADGEIEIVAQSPQEAERQFESVRNPTWAYSRSHQGHTYTYTPFFKDEPAKPKVASSKVAHYHLIPTVALEHIAKRFEEGVKRKGDGAWNATTKNNQDILMDKDFLIERLSHAINHALLLRDQLVNGVKEGEEQPIANASALAWGGVYAITACQALFGENK